MRGTRMLTVSTTLVPTEEEHSPLGSHFRFELNVKRKSRRVFLCSHCQRNCQPRSVSPGSEQRGVQNNLVLKLYRKLYGLDQLLLNQYSNIQTLIRWHYHTGDVTFRIKLTLTRDANWTSCDSERNYSNNYEQNLEYISLLDCSDGSIIFSYIFGFEQLISVVYKKDVSNFSAIVNCYRNSNRLLVENESPSNHAPANSNQMAEVNEELAGNEEEAPQEDIDAILDALSPDELWERGKNHHKARENALAVECFARCCERWAADRGDLDDSLGAVYLLYGQALLNLAREDGEVVVDENIPAAAAACHGDDEFIEDEPFDENRSPTKTRQKAQADEAKENKAASASVSTPVASSSGKSSVKKAPLKENGEKTSDIDSDDYDDDDISVSEFDEDAPDWLKNRGKPEKKEPEDEAAKERLKKLEEEIRERSKALEEKREAAKKQAAERKAASAARRRQEEEEVDEESDEDEEGAVDNLQLAWEVLECAKKIFSKQTDSAEKLAETLDSLGEVSSESEKFDLAISDFEACLKLRLEMEGKDRQVAETYYKLGLTLGLDKQLDAAIVNFEKAHERLEKYMIKLKDGKELDQLSQSVKSEVEEITDLLPEIQAKIVDFKDARQEAKEQISKMITEAFQGRDQSEEASTSNGSAVAGSSKDSSANGAARATDISHLVKRKRQTDDPDGDGQPPKKTSL